jgi:NitT/TauT family transport system substrate-binding protein
MRWLFALLSPTSERERRIMRRIRNLVCSLFIVIPVITLASCSSGGDGSSGVSSGPAPEVSSIVVDAVPTADEAGLYIANQRGYFKQQGLSIKIVPILGGEPGMADLQTGKAQIIVGNYVSFILAQIHHTYKGKPLDLRIIADGSHMQQGNQAIYVMPDSRFKTVADLTKFHAKVGINTPNNVGEVLFGSLFKENGLNLADINKVYEPFPLMIAGLATGKLDAAWLPEPFGTIAQETIGAVTLDDFNQGSLQNFPIGAYIGTRQWVQSHPNTVAAFLRALQEGQQVADTDRAAVESALMDKGNLTAAFAATPLQAATMTLDTYPLGMDVPSMQRVSDAMFEFGLEQGLKHPYQITNMIQHEPGEIGG